MSSAFLICAIASYRRSNSWRVKWSPGSRIGTVGSAGPLVIELAMKDPPKQQTNALRAVPILARLLDADKHTVGGAGALWPLFLNPLISRAIQRRDAGRLFPLTEPTGHFACFTLQPIDLTAFLEQFISDLPWHDRIGGLKVALQTLGQLLLNLAAHRGPPHRQQHRN